MAKETAQNGADGATASSAADAPVFDPKKTDEAAKRRPTVSHMLGEIVWLLTQSPTHKHFAMTDLEWLIMPPLLLEQYRVFHGETTPVGLALWAWLSPEAEAKLNAGAGRLRPDEWRAGGLGVAHLQDALGGGDGGADGAQAGKTQGNLWLVDLIAPFATPDNKMVEAMLADLMQTAFKGQTFRFHKTDPATGKRDVLTLKGVDA